MSVVLVTIPSEMFFCSLHLSYQYQGKVAYNCDTRKAGRNMGTFLMFKCNTLKLNLFLVGRSSFHRKGWPSLPWLKLEFTSSGNSQLVSGRRPQAASEKKP